MYVCSLTDLRETQLSKRVADWTHRLEPVLRAQETVPEFDIHTYSDLVLTQVDSVVHMDTTRRLSELGLKPERDGYDKADIDEETAQDENRPENNAITMPLSKMKETVFGKLKERLQTDSSLVDFAEIVRLSASLVKSADNDRDTGDVSKSDDNDENSNKGSENSKCSSKGNGNSKDDSSVLLRSRAEVCRVFLACLMLANMGNLDLAPSAAADRAANKDLGSMSAKEKAWGSFAVRLLNLNRKRDVENFKAPSIDEGIDVDDVIAAVAARGGSKATSNSGEMTIAKGPIKRGRGASKAQR
jgi:Condensin II complex subunit CAP-H2 or CNDH2, C-term